MSCNLLKGERMGRSRTFLMSLVIVVFLTPQLHSNQFEGEGSLKQYLITYIRKGQFNQKLPETHPLHPISTAPILATTSYLAFSEDPAILKDIYPRLTKYIYSLFSKENLHKTGLLYGNVTKEERASVSVIYNALANLEVYSLYLIAKSIGEYEDALDFLFWSKKLSRKVSSTFFDPTFAYFFSIGRDGRPIISYNIENLLPLALDKSLGKTQRQRVCYKLQMKISEQKGTLNTGQLKLTGDSSLEYFIIAILNSSAEFRRIIKPYIRGRSIQNTRDRNLTLWKEFIDRNEPTKKILGLKRAFDICENLSGLLEKYQILAQGTENPFKEVNDLLKLLGEEDLSQKNYTSAISKTNSILISASKFLALVSKKEELWRLFDLPRWNRLSPRTRRIIKESFSEAISEIRFFKILLSEKFSRSSGIMARVELPIDRIEIGKKIPFKAEVRTIRDTLIINYAYVQIGDFRWKMSTKEELTILPNNPPLSFSSEFALPQAPGPGLRSLPIFFDLNCNGKRLELHSLESVYLSKQSKVTISFPSGKKLEPGKTLTIELAVRYPSEQSIRGKVEGSFLKEIETNPALPAGFLINKNKLITFLPIKVKQKGKVPPGRYPFSIAVSVGNEDIGYFSDEFIKPFNWLYLGPLSVEELKNSSPLSFQNELLKEFTLNSGRVVRWQLLPEQAIDSNGKIAPGLVTGKCNGDCILLYTAFDMQSARQIHWRIETDAEFNIWLNSEPLTRPQTKTTGGSMLLRKGINTILLQLCCKGDWSRTNFYVGDDNWLPIFGMNNDLSRSIDGFEHISSEGLARESKKGKLREVKFSLDYPEASTVSVIGTFNNWDPLANPLIKDNDGVWKTTVYLAPGRYSYKFLIDKKTKITDPSSQVLEPDGFGGFNSVLIVR